MFGGNSNILQVDCEKNPGVQHDRPPLQERLRGSVVEAHERVGTCWSSHQTIIGLPNGGVTPAHRARILQD